MPIWNQTIIWTNIGLLSIGYQETNFCEILITIQTFSFKKMLCKCSLQSSNHFVSASMYQHCQMQYMNTVSLLVHLQAINYWPMDRLPTIWHETCKSHLHQDCMIGIGCYWALDKSASVCMLCIAFYSLHLSHIRKTLRLMLIRYWSDVNIWLCTTLLEKCAHVCTFLSQSGALWYIHIRPISNRRRSEGLCYLRFYCTVGQYTVWFHCEAVFSKTYPLDTPQHAHAGKI